MREVSVPAPCRQSKGTSKSYACLVVFVPLMPISSGSDVDNSVEL